MYPVRKPYNGKESFIIVIEIQIDIIQRNRVSQGESEFLRGIKLNARREKLCPELLFQKAMKKL